MCFTAFSIKCIVLCKIPSFCVAVEYLPPLKLVCPLQFSSSCTALNAPVYMQISLIDFIHRFSVSYKGVFNRLTYLLTGARLDESPSKSARDGIAVEPLLIHPSVYLDYARQFLWQLSAAYRPPGPILTYFFQTPTFLSLRTQ